MEAGGSFLEEVYLSEDLKDQQGPLEAVWLDRAAHAKWQNQLLETKFAPNHSLSGTKAPDYGQVWVPTRPTREGQVLACIRKEAFPGVGPQDYRGLPVAARQLRPSQQTRSSFLLHCFQSYIGDERNWEPLESRFQSRLWHFPSSVASSMFLHHSDPRCHHLGNEETHTRQGKRTEC